MVSRKYEFVWERGGNVLIFPLKITKSVDSSFGFGGQLICNECHSNLQQKYVCKCGKEYQLGEIKLRRDKDTEVIFNIDEKKQFLKAKVNNEIKVIGEIPLSEIFPNYIEFCNGQFIELYNNDEQHINKMLKLRDYLMLKGICLKAVMGYYGKNIPILVIPTSEKLLAVVLRDGRLIRSGNQKGITIAESKMKDELKEFTLDKNADLYEEFIKLKMENKEIPTIKIEKKEEPVSETLFFEEELTELKKKKPIAVEIKK